MEMVSVVIEGSMCEGGSHQADVGLWGAPIQQGKSRSKYYVL
jgi:hypothetical protein